MRYSILASLSLLWLTILTPSSNARSRVKDLPKLFNYDSYLRQYDKSYGPADDSNRNSIFIGKSLSIFKHNTLYLQRKSSYYLSQSPMMDLTSKELERAQGQNPDLDLKPVQEARDLGDVPANFLKSVEKLTNDIMPDDFVDVAEQDEDFIGTSSENLQNALDNKIEDYVSMVDSKKQANSDNEKKSNMQIHLDNMKEDYMTPVAADKRASEMKLKIAKDLKQSSPHKMYVDSVFPEEKEESIEQLMASFSGSINNLIEDDPSDNVDSSFSDAVAGLLDEIDEDFQGNITEVMKPDAGQSRIKYKIDWRVTGCIGKPKSQQQCNACYIFATLDLLEYFYCRQTKKKASFSVQHVLDCGREQGVINGCRGGRMSEVGKFVRNQGLRLESEYPYKGEHDGCKSRSRLQNLVESNIVSWQLFDSITAWYTWARKSPILVGINMPADFHVYGGGIHDGQNCNINETHAMLLVGSGVQDGNDFWLLKNSFSEDWGEKGYFRLSKSALLNCFGSAIVARATFSS